MPLSIRARAMQEKYLSPRALKFGSDKTSWSYRRIQACEGSLAHSLDLEWNGFPSLFQRETCSDQVSLEWLEVVGQYSGCKMTLWKDKWPAFQGLANEVAKAQDWRVVHGLGHHRLGADLLWRTLNLEPGTLELGEPSRSWLNAKGRTVLPYTWQADVIDASIFLQAPSVLMDTKASTGDIPNSVIQIEACMTELETVLPVKLSGNCTLTVKYPTFPSDKPDRLLPGWWFPDSTSTPNGDLWALHIMSCHGSCRDAKSCYCSTGLVVVAVKDRSGYWRRIGFCNTSELYLYNKDDLSCPWNRKKTTIYLV